MRDYNYPIYFLDGTCIACGSPGSVVPINKFGNIEGENALYPIHKMVCRKCGREYGITWKSSKKDSSELDTPIPMSRNYIDEFITNVQNELNNN